VTVRAPRRPKVLNDTEWAALPLEIRMWCMDQARRTLPLPFVSDQIEQVSRSIATILTRRPGVNPSGDEDIEPKSGNWKQQRGLE
jgi:hypothetical protein